MSSKRSQRTLAGPAVLVTVLCFLAAISFAETAAKSTKSGRATSQNNLAGKKGATIPPTFSNVRYGPHERHVLDFWKADSNEPTPILIYFHGGGFRRGDKSRIHRKPVLAECLKAGISVASANYRLIEHASYPAQMLDGALVIQFVRSRADEFNIDPQKAALAGASAGANMALWIALHDDLAEPNGNDLLSRISTRVCCVVSFNGQCSNDTEFIVKHIGGSVKNPHPSTCGFFGVRSVEERLKPEIRKMAYESSAINYVTEDDPPLFLTYGGDLTPTPLPEDTPTRGALIHHPRFGELLKEKYKQVGNENECLFYYRSKPAPKEAHVEFLLRHFGRKPLRQTINRYPPAPFERGRKN